jgi:hypothetical protein
MYRSLIALTATIFIVGTAFAESDQENKPRREHRGPPEAAFEACSNSVQGDPCSFEGRRSDTVEGNCDTPPEEQILACKPEGGPPKRQLERS